MTLAFILSTLGFIAAIAPSFIKGKNLKWILFMLVCANLLYSCSYLAEGKGINGSAAGFLGAAIAGVNYLFESKNREIPLWLIGIYAAAMTAVQLTVAPITYMTIVILLASGAFLMCTVQKNGAAYRIWALVNVLLWVFYDICTKSYGILPFHSVQALTVLVGMFLHDRKKEK